MSERLTSEQLDQLEAALEAMTPPPWDDASKYPGIPTVRLFSGARYIGSLGNSDDAKETTEANAHGIVSFVNHARALLAAARENERLRDALEEIASRENWGIGEHEGNDATVWQGDSAPFDIARAALGEQR